MIKFVFWMPKEMKADLKRIAKEKYMSMADIIRMAVRALVEEEKD